MAHFAQLDKNNIVLQVIVVNNDVMIDENQSENEQLGIDFCKSLFGADTNWIQTSYNNKIRYRYAGIGYSYDPVRDVFIPPKPYESWLLDENVYDWVSPVPYPDDDKYYIWEEALQEWKEIDSI